MRIPLIALIALSLLGAGSSGAAQQPKLFGVMDDSPVVALASKTGFNIVKRTVWIAPSNNSWDNSSKDPRFIAIPAKHRDTIDQTMVDARNAGIKIILELYPVIKFGLPNGPSQMRGTCDVAKDLASRYHDVLYGIEVGVEPNNYTFNHNQFNPDGTQSSAGNYERWLAICYDKIKSVAPDVAVIGGSLASSGEDDPHKRTSSTSPVLFIQKFCEALTATGRTKPVMDLLDVHSYPNPEDQDPTVEHPAPSTAITIADYAKLDSLLGCFNKAGLPKPLYIWGEGGYNTAIPQSQMRNYTGKKPDSVRLIDEVTQGRYIAKEIQMAYCQPRSVGFINFHIVDDADLASDWQSGLIYAGQTRKLSSGSTSIATKQSLKLVQQALQAVQSGNMQCN